MSSLSIRSATFVANQPRARLFSDAKPSRRFEKPVPIEADHDAVPENLKRFICVDQFEPRITIKRTSPRELDEETVDSLASHLCKVGALDVQADENKEHGIAHPVDGILWPNPLLRRFRELAGVSRNHRLNELCRSSSSHGISWDALDKLYMSFRDARDASIEDWDGHAAEIADFASKVAREKITKWLGESQPCPPRLLRKWTHLIFRRWRERYLHVYSTRMLSRFLKGEVTDRVLLRESNECSAKGDGIEELPFSAEPSEYNPHFVRRIVKEQ